MKCPIRMIAAATTQTPYEPRLIYCIQEDCAWWDPSLRICCLRTIAGKLDDIDTALGGIQDKMPHEEQFRK